MQHKLTRGAQHPKLSLFNYFGHINDHVNNHLLINYPLSLKLPTGLLHKNALIRALFLSTIILKC